MKPFVPRTGRPRNSRRAERASVLMPASVVAMSAYQYPELLNISQRGAKLRGSSLPQKDATALLRIGSYHILCWVVWVQEDQCGVRFDEPMPLKVLKQIQLDSAIAIDMLTADEEVARDRWLEGSSD